MHFGSELLRRHTFAWVANTVSILQLDDDGEASQEDLDFLREWLRKGRPVIVRRPCVSGDGKSLYVGLALPPEPTKGRLAFRLPISLLTDVTAPPLWMECANTVEGLEMVSPLQSATDALDLPLQTFGSYAWQFYTGLSYVTANSDIDLLVPINRREDWRRFREVMSGSQKTHNRIDLEVVLNGDASFSWREFGSPGMRLLFKGNHSVWMGDKSDVETFLHD